MPKVTKSVLAADGSFALDTASPHRAWCSVEGALDAWYKAFPAVTPCVWLSAQLAPALVWLVRRRCAALTPPITVYTEQRSRETGRVE